MRMIGWLGGVLGVVGLATMMGCDNPAVDEAVEEACASLQADIEGVEPSRALGSRLEAEDIEQALARMRDACPTELEAVAEAAEIERILSDPSASLEDENRIASRDNSCEELEMWYESHPGDSNTEIAGQYYLKCGRLPSPVLTDEIRLSDLGVPLDVADCPSPMEMALAFRVVRDRFGRGIEVTLSNTTGRPLYVSGVLRRPGDPFSAGILEDVEVPPGRGVVGAWTWEYGGPNARIRSYVVADSRDPENGFTWCRTRTAR